jgi:hypothetical protein
MMLDDASSRAMTWLMLGAARRILGYCPDGGVAGFRIWLVGMGREIFTRVAADPDALANVPRVRRLAERADSAWDREEGSGWELLDYVAVEAYRPQMPGPQDGNDFYADLRASTDDCPERSVLGDEDWDFDDPAEAAGRPRG